MGSSFTPRLLSYLYKDSKDDLWYDEFTDKPAEGVYRDYFDNHKVEEEKEFKSGKAHGSHKKWWPNGKLRLQRHLKNGILNGVSIRWHFNGQMSSRWHWVSDHQGTYESWWENGNPRYIEKWSEGELCEETHFREDGTEY